MLKALFSSRVRVKLLQRFFHQPTERFYARQLARELDEHYNAVWEELGNLERIGLLTPEPRAGAKYYQLNPAFPLHAELKSLLLKAARLEPAPGEHRLEWGPLDRQQLLLLTDTPVGRRIRAMLEAQSLAMDIVRGRLRRQYPDLSQREINLRVLQEVQHRD